MGLNKAVETKLKKAAHGGGITKNELAVAMDRVKAECPCAAPEFVKGMALLLWCSDQDRKLNMGRPMAAFPPMDTPVTELVAAYLKR